VFATVYRIVLRTAVTRGRVIGMAALSLVGILIGLGIGLADDVDRLDAGTQLVNSFGLSLFVPVVCLIFASAAFGDRDAPVVFGWIVTGHQIGAASAAFLAGYLRTVQGNYVDALVFAGGTAVFAAFLALMIGRVGPRPVPATA